MCTEVVQCDCLTPSLHVSVHMHTHKPRSTSLTFFSSLSLSKANTLKLCREEISLLEGKTKYSITSKLAHHRNTVTRPTIQKLKAITTTFGESILSKENYASSSKSLSQMELREESASLSTSKYFNYLGNCPWWELLFTVSLQI